MSHGGLLDPEGRVTAFGHALLADLGFRAGDDLRGLPFTALWPHADRAGISAAIAEAVNGGTASVGLDMRYVTGDATRREVVLGPAAPDAVSVRVAS